MKKPLYFALSVWGERYCNYLLNYCVPSLLAPNNIPALKLGHYNQFIICAPAEDWSYIDQHPIISRLRKHIKVVHIEISPCPSDASARSHSNIGHRAAIQMMWTDQVYGSLIAPNQLFADGCISFLQETIEKGYDAIFVPANLRTRSDYLFPAIEKVRRTDHQDKTAEHNALIITKGDLVKIKEKSIHDTHKIYEWRKICYHSTTKRVYWLIYEKQEFKGFLYYTSSWAIALIDYSAIEAHDTSLLDIGSINIDHFDKRLGKKNIYFVTNSVEYIGSSWSMKDEHPIPTAPGNKFKGIVTLQRLYAISRSFYGIFDVFKRRRFKKAIIYSCDNQLDSFFAMQKKANRLLNIATSKYFYIILKREMIPSNAAAFHQARQSGLIRKHIKQKQGTIEMNALLSVQLASKAFEAKGSYLLATKLQLQAEIHSKATIDVTQQVNLLLHKEIQKSKPNEHVRELKKFDFLVVPTLRGGSTSLVERLNLHPYIITPTKSEVDNAIEKGEEINLCKKYNRQLCDKNPDMKAGIVQHGFIAGQTASEEVARRLSNVVGGAQFIQSVRDPISSILSEYKNSFLHLPVMQGQPYGFKNANSNTIYTREKFVIKKSIEAEAKKQIAKMKKIIPEQRKIDIEEDALKHHFSKKIPMAKHYKVGAIYNKYFPIWEVVDPLYDYNCSPGQDISNLMLKIKTPPELRLIRFDDFAMGFLPRLMCSNYLEVNIFGYTIFVYLGISGFFSFTSTTHLIDFCHVKDVRLASDLNIDKDEFSLCVDAHQWRIIPFESRKIILESGIFDKLLKQVVIPHWSRDYKLWIKKISPYFIKTLSKAQLIEVKKELSGDLADFLKVHPEYEYKWSSVKEIFSDKL